jgi:uncharacterized repeat protein (TIGR01451 family)
MKKNSVITLILIILMCVSMFAIAFPQVAAKPVPSIRLTTTTDRTNVQVGDTVTYTFEVTNTGKVTLFGVEVDGTLTGVATKQSESKRTNDKLESWEIWVFTATYTVETDDPDPLVNSATATAYTRQGVAYYAYSTHKVYLYGTEGDMFPDVLTSPNQQSSGNWFGCSVAIGEGVIVVGAAYESIPNPLYDPTLRKQTEPSQIYAAGRAYVYNATTGLLLSTLTSPNPTAPGFFGYSVAVGEDVIVVGAPKETSGGVTLAGNAYVFDAITYDLLYSFTTPHPVSDDNGYGFGTSVAVNDGIIGIGSSWETVSSFTGAGRVYLYNVEDGTELSFSPLVTPDPQQYGRFGLAVAIGEGVIAVGAAYEDVDATEIAGRVYVYDAATGALTDTVTSPNAESAGKFGFSVAVGDGKIAIGAFGETVDSAEQAGRAYVYDLATETITHTLTSESPEYRGFFGNSVAVGEGLIVVGAEIETSGGYAYAGNAYVYNTAGVSQTTLISLNPEEWETFGWSVAVGGGLIVVGAYDAVYIFE